MATAVHTTACTLDCPDACSLAVTVTDGVISNIDAGPGNPLTDGWICAKVKKHAKRVYSPERVLTPQIRVGAKGDGAFRDATWEEALALIADRMRTALASPARGDAIAAFTYNSSAGMQESDSVSEAFFEAVGATRVSHTICAATMGAAWSSVYPGMLSADPLDIVHAKVVVVWGANPTVSNTHLPPLIEKAAQRGAKVVVIDPRRTAMAKRADLHLAVRPGTDVVLALAVANIWAKDGSLDHAFIDAHTTGAGEFLSAAKAWPVEAAATVCGLEAQDIRTFANWYGATQPAMLRIGWGQERNANGGAACRAILALPALVNHFSQQGGGVIGSTSAGAVVQPRRRWPEVTATQRRVVNMHQLGQWLAPAASDPCQVLFVQGANPAVMCPDAAVVSAALSREDIFTVVHEQVMTDTARYADVVLPATTAFEINDIAGSYGSYVVQPVVAVINRVGESRSNDEVGLALAQSLGFDWTTPTAVSTDDAGPRLVRKSTIQFLDTSPTDGRARLTDALQSAPAYVPVADTFPLVLISPATSKLISSMFGEFQSPDSTVMLHPVDAGERGLVSGQAVRLVNAQGSVVASVVISDDTRPGVVVAPKGVWLRNYEGSIGLNVLIPATADALAGGACFNDARVEVMAR